MCRSKAIVALVGLRFLFLTSGGAFSAEQAMTWPPGWEMRDVSIPGDGSDDASSKLNRVAVKLNQQGSALAVIGLTELTREPNEAPIDTLAVSIRRAMESEYGAKGFRVLCGQSTTTTLGALPALQSLCEIHRGDVLTVKRLMVIAVRGQSLLVLNYTAPPASFDVYFADYITMRNGLRFE